MIVCICNRINCKDIRQAVESGARTPKAVQSARGCKFNCGKCKVEISQFISDEMDKSVSAQTLVAAE